ncbi:MAG: hypothetical protein WKF75_05825 [Singulisphaera sp.]
MPGESPATSGLLAVLAQVAAMAMALVQDAEDLAARRTRSAGRAAAEAARGRGELRPPPGPGQDGEAETRREPVYRWTNPTRVGGQEDVFVWTYKRRPEVVASIFSHPHNGGRERPLP